MNQNLKLHDASKELPKKSCEVIAFNVNEYGMLYSVANLYYSKQHKKFNVRDDHDEEQAKRFEIKVSFWACLPKTLGNKKKR